MATIFSVELNLGMPLPAAGIIGLGNGATVNGPTLLSQFGN